MKTPAESVGRKNVERMREMSEQIREMHLRLAQKDLETISNLNVVIALQKDRDRLLRFVRRVADARTPKQLFVLQRRARHMIDEE